MSTHRVALITGASSGIGEALAVELAKQGWKLGLIARRLDRLTELSDKLRSQGATVSAVAADVGERSEIVAAITQLAADLGSIDLLIANAGLGQPEFLDPFSVDRIEAMIRVNLLGVIYTIEGVLPEMLRRQQGHIAVVSSMAAYRGLPGSAGYCASKAGISRFMEGLRISLAEHRITTTTIHPGFVRTPMTDANKFKMPFLVEPADAARRIVRALNRRVKVYNFPWQMNLLMRLLHLLPDWLIARTLPRKSDG